MQITKSKKWSIFAAAALVASVLVPAAPAQAATSFPCGTSGTYEVDGSGVLTGNTACKGAVTIDSSVTSIAANAMKAAANVTAITSVVVPSSVTAIGASAFQGNPINSLSFSEGLLTIGDYAFESMGGTSRVNITIPNSVTSIGNRAFHQSRLGDIIIGTGLVTVPSHGFYNNFGLGATSVTLKGGALTTIDTAGFDGFRGESIIIPEGVTTINERAFEGGSPLKRIYLPSTLTTFGINVFNGRPASALVTLSYCGTTPAVQNYASYPGGAHPTGCFVGATYKANDGTTSFVVEDNAVGATASVRTNSFTRTGYNFTGWTANQDGTGQAVSQGVSRTFAAHETFYAQWAVAPRVVTFDGNGATSGTMANQSSTTSVRLTANAFSRSGYTFAGWNTDQAGTSGSAYADEATFGFVSSIALFAQWTLNPVSSAPAPAPTPTQYTVVFEVEAGQPVVTQVVEEKKTITPPANPTRVGYTFDGWKISSLGELVYDFSKMLITSPVTLTAVWVPNKYTVTFKKSAASKVITKSALHSEKLARLAPPKKAGYKFAGWRIGSSKGKAFRFSYQIKKNLNLVAAWKKL